MEFADCHITCAIVFVAMLGFLRKKNIQILSFPTVSKPILTPCQTQSGRWKHVRLPTWTFKSFHLLELIKEASTSNQTNHEEEHEKTRKEITTWIQLPYLKKNNGCKNVAFLFCCVPLGLKLTKVKGKLIQIARLHRTPCPNTSDRRQCCNSSTIRDTRFVRSHTERIT